MPAFGGWVSDGGEEGGEAQGWPVGGEKGEALEPQHFPGCYSEQLFIYSEAGDTA